MFKSFSDSLRSFWQPKPHETVETPEKTRKRSAAEKDEDDSDVEIVSVKRPKQEDFESSSGLLSFLRVPMSKMSEWVRKKTVRQDHFFVRPIPSDSQWTTRKTQEEEQEGLRNASSSFSITNGTFALHCTQNTDSLSRPPIHSNSSFVRNDVNGDMHMVDRQPVTLDLSTSSSRRSSCSSTRLGAGRRSTVDQLKEREDYLKLLQQHTTVDLGYHNKQPTLSHPKRPSGYANQSQRKSGLFLPLPSSATPSSSLSSSSFKTDNFQPSSRFRVTPSRVFQSSLLPSDRIADQETCLLSSSKFAVPRVPGRRQQVQSSMPPRHRTRQQNEHSEAGKPDRAVPPADADDSDVILLGETTSKSPQSTSQLNFRTSEYLDMDWLNKMNERYAASEKERLQLIKEAEMKKKLLEERREQRLCNLDKKLKQQMRLFDEEPEVIEEFPLPEVPQEKPLPELTDNMEREISAALDGGGPPTQVLVEGFRLQLTRSDIATLRGLQWLNDEVINFYMNMLMERGEQKGFFKTYAFNTFFYPKLIQGGHDAVKRWTRKMDIFSYEYIVIPVHLGVHWCLCVVFVKAKKICYYDSMGGNNNQCLNAVRQYLYDESLQKRNVRLDLSEWTTEIVKDIPQQMNGSDCGMFSCMYAESITRGAEITFTQKDMPYFRRRMVYELLKRKLL